jgi:glucose/arabinose dehydrogenase
MVDEVGTIHTIAGTGVKGYSGDGGPALSAQFDTPSDIAVAPNGTLYIADTMNDVVRAISPGGVVSTFAGNGTRGFAGDGGAAKDAELDRPYGVGLAPNGDVYVADTHNQRVRLVSGISQPPPPTPRPTPPPEIIPCTDVVGSICTFVGNGLEGVQRRGQGSSRDGAVLAVRHLVPLQRPPRVPRLEQPQGARDPPRRDHPDDRRLGLRRRRPGRTSAICTPAGAPPLTVDLNHPTDVLEFPNHDIIFMAWHNHKIRVIDHETGARARLMGAGAAFAGDGGPAKDARVNQPPHGTWDGNGNFFSSTSAISASA